MTKLVLSAISSPTVILDFTPYSAVHGVCRARYHNNTASCPYRNHGQDPNNLNWRAFGNLLLHNEFAHTGDQTEQAEGIDFWDPSNHSHNQDGNNTSTTVNSSSTENNNEGYATQPQEENPSSSNSGYATQPENDNLSSSSNDTQAQESSYHGSASSNSNNFSSTTEDVGEDLFDSTSGSDETNSVDDVDSHTSFLDSRHTSELSVYTNNSSMAIDEISFQEEESCNSSSSSSPEESSNNSDVSWSNSSPEIIQEVQADNYNADDEQSF